MWFEVILGVRQGCLLSALLCAVAMGCVMRRALETVVDVGRKLTDLDFADDVFLSSDSAHQLQILTNAL